MFLNVVFRKVSTMRYKADDISSPVTTFDLLMYLNVSCIQFINELNIYLSRYSPWESDYY